MNEIQNNDLVEALRRDTQRLIDQMLEREEAEKHNAIGSQGFEAKMRLVMELRQDPERHNIRHLCIVKGNYLPSEYKHDSFELRFTPQLNFEATGERVPFSMLKERNEEKKAAEAERIALVQSLRDEGKSYREIAEMTDIPKSTVHRLLEKVN